MTQCISGCEWTRHRSFLLNDYQFELPDCLPGLCRLSSSDGPSSVRRTVRRESKARRGRKVRSLRPPLTLAGSVNRCGSPRDKQRITDPTDETERERLRGREGRGTSLRQEVYEGEAAEEEEELVRAAQRYVIRPIESFLVCSLSQQTPSMQMMRASSPASCPASSVLPRLTTRHSQTMSSKQGAGRR